MLARKPESHSIPLYNKDKVADFVRQGTQNPPWSDTCFGMLPRDVSERKDLTLSAKVLIAVMHQESVGTGIVFLSDEVLSQKCGVGRRTVGDARVLLQKMGLIIPHGDPVNQVQAYRLLHIRHGEDARNKINELKESKKQKKLVSGNTPVFQCTKCPQKMTKQTKSGLCGSCAEDEIFLPARVAAIEGRLGKHITDDQMVSELKHSKLKLKVGDIRARRRQDEQEKSREN